jgi:trehalose 6-phosphate phosphatase
MKYLFGAEGEAALAALARARALLAFDFDGTLAPIVALPDNARVSLPVAQRLQRLAQRLPVAIVSGRRVEDIRARVQFEPHYLIGSHGAEDPQRGVGAELGPTLDGVRGRLTQASAALHALGVLIEDKRESIALHYRLARDRQAALEAIERLLADLGSDVRVFGGKMVANVVPAGAADKADAMLDLAARAGVETALFVGDDLNDEPVFERAPPHWLTVRVGREGPPSQARYFVHSVKEVPLLLDRLLAALPAAADLALQSNRV